MNQSDITSIETRLKLLGYLMCFAAPIVFLVIIWTVLAPSDNAGALTGGDTEMFIWILSAMSIAEPVIGYVLRKRQLNADAVAARSVQGNVSQGIFAGHLVGYAFAICPAVFGMVIFLVTHNATLASVLICISPIAYLFFRPTESTVRDLAREAEAKLAIPR